MARRRWENLKETENKNDSDESFFNGADVQVILKNGFKLFGKCLKMNDYGIFLETKQKRSFINFDDILHILEDEGTPQRPKREQWNYIEDGKIE